MFFYVNTWHVVWLGHELIVTSGFPQLIGRRNAENGPFCNHTLVKIVRLTIESNVLTSVSCSAYSNHMASDALFSHWRDRIVVDGRHIPRA
jgi:hypothetical protein